jgi:hypothetical protein
MSTRPTATHRRRPRRPVRLLAAALTAAAALALTACNDGEGLRDEGPSGTATHPTDGPTASGASAPLPSPSR